MCTGRSTGLVDVLDRVLDKGLVVAGDIRVSLAEVELLTIRIRLIVCSIDKAEQIGLDWWQHDPHLSAGAAERLGGCEKRGAASEQIRAAGARRSPRSRARRRPPAAGAAKPARRSRRSDRRVIDAG